MARMNKEFVYGIHAVRHVLEQTPDAVLELWIKDDKKQSAELDQIIKIARKNTIALQTVSARTLENKTHSSQHQGIALLRRTRHLSNENDLEAWLRENEDKTKLFLILDNVQDPHNLGACLRTADAVGVDGLIVSKDKSVGLTATVSKVASGAAETVSFYTVTNLARTIRKLKEHNIWIMGGDGEAKQSLYETDFTSSVALVLGAEGKGLRENTRKHCDQLISIPMQGTVESLNVSVATGVCLFEVLRQRQAD